MFGEGGRDVAKGRHEDKRTRFLRRLCGQRFERIRFRPLDAVVVRVSDSAPPPPSVQARFDNGQPSRWYPEEGGTHLVKWPHTGEGTLAEGHWLEPGGWDHEHCDGCDRHIRPGRTFWQAEADPCYWLCPYCYRRLRQLQ
jgi:hypothetical protein